MTLEATELIEESVIIESDRDTVWALVTDMRRMSRWSPSVLRVVMKTPAPVAVGSRTLNINRHRFLVWITRSHVTSFEPPRRFAFRIRESRVVWAFELEDSDGGGTVLTQRRETPNGINQKSLELEDRFFGGIPAFEQSLRAGMQATLSRIKVDAERSHSQALS